MLQQIIEGVYLLVTWPIVFNKSFLKKRKKKKRNHHSYKLTVVLIILRRNAKEEPNNQSLDTGTASLTLAAMFQCSSQAERHANVYLQR